MPASIATLALAATFALSLFLGILNFWFWRVRPDDRSQLWMASWLSASAVYALCRLLQYAPLDDAGFVLVPRILLSAAFSLAWLGYEMSNAFADHRPPRWERALVVLGFSIPVGLLWFSELILTSQLFVRTTPLGDQFSGVRTGGLYLPVTLLILAIGLIPMVRFACTGGKRRREGILMAVGFALVILFSLNDFVTTAFNLTWIRLVDFSYLPVAILFSYIQVARLRSYYQDLDAMVSERTEELKQVNSILNLEIAVRKRAESEILRRNEMVTALYETTRNLIMEHDLSNLLRIIVEQSTRLLQAEGGGLYLCEPEDSLVRCVVSYNTPRDYTGTVLKYGEGSAGRVAQTGESLLISDYSSWEGRAAIYDDEKPFNAVLSVPITWKGEVIGVLHALEFTRPRQFTQEELGMIMSFANQAAIAIQNARLYEQVQRDIAEREQAQQALQASEERYRLIFEANPHPMWVYDLETLAFLVVNDTAVAHYGYTHEEFLGMTLLDIRPGDELEAFQKNLSRVRQRVEWSGPWKHRKKDGTIIVVEILSHELVFNGRPARLVLSNDITERKRAEDALRASEHKFAMAFRTSPDSVNINRLSDGMYLEVNDGFTDLTGYTQDDVKGKTSLEINIWADLADRARLVQGLRKDGEVKNLEASFRLKDGQVRVGLMSAKIIEVEGETAILSMTRDITELKKAEVEIRRRADEMAALAEVSRDITSTLDLNIVLERIATYARELLQAETSAVYLFGPDDATFKAVAAQGLDADEIKREPLVLGQGILGHIGQQKTGEIVNETGSDPRAIIIQGTERAPEEHLMGIPVLVKDDLIGLIAVWRSGAGYEFQPHDLEFLTNLAEQVAVAIENARLFENVGRRYAEIEAVHTVSTSLRAAQSLNEAMPIILEKMMDIMKADGGLVDLADPLTGEIVTELAGGVWAHITGLRTPPGSGVSGRVMATGQVYTTTDVITDGLVFRPDLIGGIFATVCVPITAQHQPIGAMWIGRKTPIREDEVSLIAAVGEMVGNAIQRMLLHEKTEMLLRDLQAANLELTEAYDSTLAGWAKALELRDKETEGHSRRVSSLTMTLAREMGIVEPELTHVYRGVLLHDIGKMGIPDQILKKTGPLNDEEWEEMRKHPVYAYNMIHPIAYLRPALDIPYSHHERWDGSGYPRGLKGEDIPLPARIFAVIDVWDALVNDRPYRKAWTEAHALAYIQEQSGIQFDPQVVAKFMELVTTDA